MATTTFDNLITFSRGSNATVTGPNGLIQWAPSNLLTNSQDFEAAAWTKSDATIYANQDIGGGAFGPELVPNGDFATNINGWTTQGAATAVWSSGAALVNMVSAGTWFSDNFRLSTPILTVGRVYEIRFDARNVSGTASLRLANNATPLLDIPSLSTSFQSYSVVFTCTVTNTFSFFKNGLTGEFELDNISVKEITPAAATAPDGTLTADTATPFSGPTPIVRQTFTTSAAGAYTASVWLKSASNTNVTISLRPTGAGSPVSVVCAVTPTWQRFTVNLTAVTGVTNIQFWIEQFSQAILLWGAQLELGSTATTYNNTSVRNLLGFSEAFDNAAWVKTRCSMVTGAQANPVNGLFNAQKLMEDTAATGARSIVQSGGVIGGTETLSVYLKAAGRQWAALQLGSGGLAYYNLGDGSLGTVTGGTGSIVPIGSGWFRCSLTATRTGTTNNFVYLASANTVTSYTGDGNSGVYIYGAQLSNSASLDPYVPTPGAAPSSTAYYGPRFDYDPVTLLPRGLLIEEQRVNSLTYSDDWSNAAWVKTATTVTANATTSPDGTTNADKVVENTAASPHAVYAAFTYAAGTTYAASVYAKAAERSWIYLGADTSAAEAVFFNLATGTVGSQGTGYVGSIQNVGNGWYRCTVVITQATALPPNFFVVGLATGDNTASYTGNGTSGVFLYGAQLEVGTFATSYIPTIASTVTRSADNATITGSLFSQWYNQPEGALIAEITSNGVPSPAYLYPIFINENGVVNNVMGFASNSGVISVRIRSGGAESMDVGSGVPMTGGIRKMAVAARANDFAFVVNGGTPLTDTSGAMPVSLNRLEIPGSNFGSSHVRAIRYVPARAADFQLQGLTT
jgi:hypothetical protein